MKTISIADITLRETSLSKDYALSFKEKIELAKQLDRIRTDVIELPPVVNERVDTLLIRTVTSVVKNSVLSCQVGFPEDNAQTVWGALKDAAQPRLMLRVPVSPVQMEYFCHKKPPVVLEMLRSAVAGCKALCPDVEFCAVDATRADIGYLCTVVEAAVGAGANVVTLCDTAGIFTADELADFINKVREGAPSLSKALLSVEISDELSMSTASVFRAIREGAGQIKTMVCGSSYPLLENVVHAMRVKGDMWGISCGISVTEITRAVRQMQWLTESKKSASSPFDSVLGSSDDSVFLSRTDNIADVSAAVASLGYDLSEDDIKRVYDAFIEAAQKKDVLGARELDAIVASVALQVPAAYEMVSYVINSGNVITATANIRLRRDGMDHDGVSVGDGPIDAAFLAIEQITGHHYELDDFQIQAVTQSREAMGSALVKLRSEGRLYSGKGISTDIIGASILAYISALNKIVYGEA